jgi:hypothetical protein
VNHTETYDLFDRLLAQYPGAFIAGGAVRDAELGYPIKDIDLWISVEDLDMRLTLVSDSDADEYLRRGAVGSDSPVIAVLKDQRDWCPYPIHIMLLEPSTTAQQVLDRFDYGLCKIAYTKAGLHLTPEYVRDERNHRLTLINGEFTSTERYQRLKAKFQGWQIDDPEDWVDPYEAPF